MRCYGIVWILLVFACTPFLPSLNAEGNKKDSSPQAELIVRLVQQLGSERQSQRDTADDRLLELGESALPLLRQARDDENPEIRRRVQKLVESITCKIEERAAEALLAEVNKDGFDRFIERMVSEEGFDTEQRWKALDGLVALSVKRASEVSGKPFQKPMSDILKLPVKRRDLEEFHTRERLLMSAVPDPFHGVQQSVLLCRGSLSRCTSLKNSIVIVSGDIEHCTDIHNCVVICRRQIQGVTGIDKSLILATGGIGRATGLDDNILQIAGVKSVTSSWNNVYLNVEDPKTNNHERDQWIPTDRGPLQMLKFSSDIRKQPAPK